jgi:hypothetical protein
LAPKKAKKNEASADERKEKMRSHLNKILDKITTKSEICSSF